jgi:hypothetical protein
MGIHSDSGEALFWSLTDAAEELRGLWIRCSKDPSFLRDSVLLTTNLRHYSNGPIVEMCVDAEVVSGIALAWCLEISNRGESG